jgi:hypothetical protein
VCEYLIRDVYVEDGAEDGGGFSLYVYNTLQVVGNSLFLNLKFSSMFYPLFFTMLLEFPLEFLGMFYPLFFITLPEFFLD